MYIPVVVCRSLTHTHTHIYIQTHTHTHTQYAAKGRLDESYAPFIRKPRSSSSSTSGWGSGASGSSGAGVTTTSVRQRWNWIPTQRAGGAESKEVGFLLPLHSLISCTTECVYFMTCCVVSFPAPLVCVFYYLTFPPPLFSQSQAAKKAGPTIIIFIVGGMTYSEMRAIYEVSKATSDCEVIIGECAIVTPNNAHYVFQLMPAVFQLTPTLYSN